MEPLSLAQVAGAVRGRIAGGEARLRVGAVSTDSRSLAVGALFVCLRGPRHDGHDHAAAAVSAGAAALLAERELPGAPTIVVGDSGLALGELGGAVRQGLGRAPGAGAPTVVAITGTNGKTSTKDLAAAALAARWPTVSSPRSFNNAVGVPLTLLAVEAGTRAVVAEIGTNAPGEVAQLAGWARPEVAVITNVQAGHLQGLGSLEGVRREKGALLDALHGPRLAVLNRDDPSFEALAARAPGPVVSFGFAPGSDWRAESLACGPQGTRFTARGHEVRLRLLGAHAASNALAALACAEALGVPLDDAIAALAGVAPAPGRLHVRRAGALTVVDDSYNANPGSLAASAAALAAAGIPGRLVAVVGEMLELGGQAAALHRLAGEALAAARPALLIAVGAQAAALREGALAGGLPSRDVVVCGDLEAASAALADALRPGDVVLLKGSRRGRLDLLADRLLAEAAATAAPAVA